MYDCRRTNQLLESYVDNELDAVTTRAISEHLEVCAACSRKMEEIRLQNELVARAVKSIQADNSTLRASIEAATIAKHHKLLQWSVQRIPVLVTVSALAILFILTAIFYLPKFLSPYTSPLFRAAADDHIMCSHDPDGPDWARDLEAIAAVEDSFIGHNQHAPINTANGFELVRARVCVLNGEKFLHLFYETHDGRAASLFVGPNHKEMPLGEQAVTLEGKIIQVAHAGDLNLMSTDAGNHLVIAAAREDKIATTLLLSAVSSLSA